MAKGERTTWIVERARGLGFELCGVASMDDYVSGLALLPEWLARGYSGEMQYLHDARRSDPGRVLDGARSIIVCALNYNTDFPHSTEQITRQGPSGWISRYAWGDDYHDVLGRKLEALVAAMRAEFREPFEALWYVDTGPILERVAAEQAGLGWLAKNTCLINEHLGSWLFLGAIVTTLELAPSLSPAEAPPADLCGNCTMCIDACPTGAIVEPYVLDARRCISYLTIELRGSIPEDLRPQMGRHVFGCDICQDVCPWNRKAPIATAHAFRPRRVKSPPVGAELAPPSPLETTLHAPPMEWLASLTEDEFRAMFRGSAITRTKWRGLVRNACVAIGNVLAAEHSTLTTDSRARLTSLLERLAASGDPIVAEHARWALAQRKTG